MDDLQQIGLSPYEGACYLALLKKGQLKGHEVAGEAKIPRTSAYPALERLQSKGFVTLVQSSPKVYRANDPETAIRGFVNSQKDSLDSSGERAIDVLKRVETDKGVPEVELMVGSAQSYAAARKLGDTTEKEFWVIGSGSVSSLSSAAQYWSGLVRRGVDVRVMIAEIGSPDILKEIRKSGVQIRLSSLRDISLIVSDRKVAHVALKSGNLPRGRMVLRIVHEEFARMHAEFFERMWRKAGIMN